MLAKQFLYLYKFNTNQIMAKKTGIILVVVMTVEIFISYGDWNRKVDEKMDKMLKKQNHQIL